MTLASACRRPSCDRRMAPICLAAPTRATAPILHLIHPAAAAPRPPLCFAARTASAFISASRTSSVRRIPQ